MMPNALRRTTHLLCGRHSWKFEHDSCVRSSRPGGRWTLGPAITEFMINKKPEGLSRMATIALVLLFTICGCKTQPGQPTNEAPATLSPAAHHLENGAYFIL